MESGNLEIGATPADLCCWCEGMSAVGCCVVMFNIEYCNILNIMVVVASSGANSFTTLSLLPGLVERLSASWMSTGIRKRSQTVLASADFETAVWTEKWSRNKFGKKVVSCGSRRSRCTTQVCGTKQNCNHHHYQYHKHKHNQLLLFFFFFFFFFLACKFRCTCYTPPAHHCWQWWAGVLHLFLSPLWSFVWQSFAVFIRLVLAISTTAEKCQLLQGRIRT